MNYEKIYNDLMSKSRSENRKKGKGVYYEAHHIIPKCMGGKGLAKQWGKHPNIVLLTGAEHFLAHKLLVEIYPKEGGLIRAYWAFVNGFHHNNHSDIKHYNIGAKEYGRVKIQQLKLKNGPLACTIEEFKMKAIKKHGDKYDYSKTIYKNKDTKVIITCKVDGHGDFEQKPTIHTNQGSGCPKCSIRSKEQRDSVSGKNVRKWTKERRDSVSGKNNSRYGKSNYDIWVEKYGEDIAKEKLEIYKSKRFTGYTIKSFTPSSRS